MIHTRIPWRVSHDTDNCDGADEFPATIWSDTHQHVATVTRADDALFIVKSANAHGEVVDALRDLLADVLNLASGSVKLRPSVTAAREALYNVEQAE